MEQISSRSCGLIRYDRRV